MFEPAYKWYTATHLIFSNRRTGNYFGEWLAPLRRVKRKAGTPGGSRFNG